MRRLLFWLIFVAASGFLPGEADDSPIQEFSGSGSTTTDFFKVQDRWEVRWNARQAVSVAVLTSDGTIVAGGAGVLRGSLFVPNGGQYYLKITDGMVPPASDSPSPGAPPTPPPAPVPSPAATNTPPPAAPDPAPVSWHLQVVQLGTSVDSSQKLTVYEPFFVPPDSAINPAPLQVAPPKLTDAQAKAEVMIKGDNATGLGFLLQTADGPCVVTNLHLLAANPNLQILTMSGTPIAYLSLKGAVDRDLALFAIKDASYTYLTAPSDDTAPAQEGDVVLIPEINQIGDGSKSVVGKLDAVGQGQVQFDNNLHPGASGAPVIHASSGKVIAVVTATKKVDLTNALAKAWAANPPPGSSDVIPYFGLRLEGVKSWETYDGAKYLNETLLLQQVHEDTRSLDSFLHGKRHRGSNPDVEGPPDSRFFLNNSTLHRAYDSYKQFASGADRSQRLSAARELLDSLQTLAGTNLALLKDPSDFYAFNKLGACEELAYRLALVKELDDLQSNLPRLDSIAQGR